MSFDILISCENYLDVFENSLVQGLQVSEEELQRIYTESYQAGSKDKIHYPSENHDISGQVLQGAIKTMRVEKDPNTNKDVPIFYIDVSRVYKNVYGDVALAAMSLSIYMRKHGKEKTIQLLSLPRGERLATLWSDVEHDYIKAIPLMPITKSHYVDASASGEQRQFYHRYFSNGENIAGNQLRLRDDSDKTNLVTFRRPLNEDEYRRSPFARGTINTGGGNSTDIVSAYGSKSKYHRETPRNYTSFALHNGFLSGFNDGGVPFELDDDGNILYNSMTQDEFSEEIFERLPYSRDVLLHELMHILNPMSDNLHAQEGLTEEQQNDLLTRTPGLSDKQYYSRLNETMGALAFLNIYSFIKHKRVLTNSSDVFHVFFADYRPFDDSYSAQRQRGSLPIELKRIYDMFDRALNDEYLRIYKEETPSDSPKGQYDMRKFLKFIDDNGLMIQLTSGQSIDKSKFDNMS